MSNAEVADRNKAIAILAKSLVRELRQNGYEKEQLVVLLTELTSLVAESMRGAARAE